MWAGEALWLQQAEIQRRLSRLPAAWRKRANARYAHIRGADETGAEANARLWSANRWRYDLLDKIDAIKLPAGASDDDICEAAKRRAAECFRVGTIAHESAAVRRGMARVCARYGIEPPAAEFDDACAIARMVDDLWWRRRLREEHARELEKLAIELGYVHRRREIYASDETVKRRGAQRARNRRILESTIAENEHGDAFTLAELAERSVANPRIKRGELMTRIRGFEEVARGVGHVGEFVTVTCPSRMHARLSQSGAINPKHDGTKPDEANKYLGRVWARVRAKLAREGIAVYGFRIAEPHHDGTPHWHLLLFMAAESRPGVRTVPRFRAIMRRYFLADSPDEAGARTARCKFVAIDPAKGSAAGYVAKYVAKNIDGYGLETDLYGESIIEATPRIEAWASTWGIRQFQQIGGPPVGVWRELRRLPVSASCDASLQSGGVAGADRVEQCRRAADEGDWRAFVVAMGGALRGRAFQALRVAREWSDKVGRYGAAVGESVCGVMDNFTGRVVRSVRFEWVFRRAAKPRALGPVSITIRGGSDGNSGDRTPQARKMPPDNAAGHGGGDEKPVFAGRCARRDE